MLPKSVSCMAVLLCVLPAPADAGDVTPLPSAHAHNDYLHDRPLLDALDNGFCSVEADIFLSDGRLLVGHSRRELTAERTLQRLYLDPLRQRVRDNGGRVYRDGPTFTLLIDIKNSGAATWHELNQAGVDLINTDKLAGLRQFLESGSE